jgi:hypothetical protein
MESEDVGSERPQKTGIALMYIYFELDQSSQQLARLSPHWYGRCATSYGGRRASCDATGRQCETLAATQHWSIFGCRSCTDKANKLKAY